MGRDKCCRNLQPRTVHPNIARDCSLTEGKFICTACGNGRCENGENACNCQDCVAYSSSSSSVPSVLTATIEGGQFASTPGSAVYHFLLTNTGDSPLSNIDFLVSNFYSMPIDPTASDASCAPSPIVGWYACQPFDLEAGATKDFVFAFNIPANQDSSTLYAKIGGPARFTVSKYVKFTQCGNNSQESNEQCDDGNLTVGDGCSRLCHLEADLDIAVSSPSVKELRTSQGLKYQLTFVTRILNAGPSDVTSFKLRTNPLPGFTLIRPASDATCLLEADRSISCSMNGLLQSGGKKNATIVLEAQSTGPVTIDFKTRHTNAIKNATTWIDDPVSENDMARTLFSTFPSSAVSSAFSSSSLRSSGSAGSSSSTFSAVCGNGIQEGTEQCEDGISCPAVNCFAPPCPEQRCDLATCSCLSCPDPSLPSCDDGVLFPQLGADANGCERPAVCCRGATDGRRCTTNMICANGRCIVDSCTCQSICPDPAPPICEGGLLFPQIGVDANGCQRPPVCCEGAASGGRCTTNMSCANGRCTVDSCTCS